MAIVRDTLIVNGTNLGQFGLEWASRRGWRSFPSADVITHNYPREVGVLFQERSEGKARTLTVSGSIKAATVAGLYTNLDAIAARLRGLVEIGFSDDDRIIRGYLEESDIGEYNPGALLPLAPFAFTFKCPDPRRYDAVAQSIAGSTDLPIGTAPVKPVVTINGTATNPTTIQLRDKDGAVVSSFTLAGTLGAGESWIVDSALSKVEHDDGGGTVTNALDIFSGDFPVLSPDDADFATSDWGQMVVTAGGPSSIAVVYKRAWM